MGAARRGAATQIAAPDQCARTWANRSTFSRQWTTVVTLPLQTLMLSSWLATLRRRLACARSMTPSTSPSILQCSQWPTLWACLSSSLATAPRVCDDGRGGWWHCSSQNLLQGRLLGQRATTNAWFSPPRARACVAARPPLARRTQHRSLQRALLWCSRRRQLLHPWLASCRQTWQARSAPCELLLARWWRLFRLFSSSVALATCLCTSVWPTKSTTYRRVACRVSSVLPTPLRPGGSSAWRTTYLNGAPSAATSTWCSGLLERAGPAVALFHTSEWKGCDGSPAT